MSGRSLRGVGVHATIISDPAGGPVAAANDFRACREELLIRNAE
jgi:hypothetical protein